MGWPSRIFSIIPRWSKDQPKTLVCEGHLPLGFVQKRAQMDDWANFICYCCQSLSHVKLFVDPMDYSLPGSSVHGFLQARILE